jgi:hypothetical protein
MMFLIQAKMKRCFLIGFWFVLFACSEQVSDVQLTDLKDHNMKIIPEKPSDKDQIKLVVFDDCTYNVLSEVTRTNKTINIRKQFNGMMKWPCVIKNDTILIGKLPEGSYNVNYTLIDTSKSSPQNISISFTFQLDVSK